MTKHMPSDERSAQILDAARACFLEKGYFATRVDEIARASGLSKGGVYFHFESKRDIFWALVEREYDRAMTFIDAVASSDADVFTKIIQMGQHFTDLFSTTDNPRFMAIIGEMSLRDEELRRLIGQLQRSYVVKIAELIRTGIERGQFREVDAESVAFLLKALVDGIQVSYALEDDIDLGPIVPAAIDMILHALQPASPPDHLSVIPPLSRRPGEG